jgi:D-tyrosyl-tRNA(Tyr) deacylase
LRDIAGDLLLVSQFTLAADTQKGLRPGFSSALPPAEAKPLFENMVQEAVARHPNTQSGVFGADMQISLLNDGPVTFILRA